MTVNFDDAPQFCRSRGITPTADGAIATSRASSQDKTPVKKYRFPVSGWMTTSGGLAWAIVTLKPRAAVVNNCDINFSMASNLSKGY
ncbi:MAG: hypothetical protein ACP5D7_18335 [Limnospira sp.]